MQLRYISAAIALGALLPFTASALSVEELQAKIENLLTQIGKLQEQLQSMQTTTSPAPPKIVCPVFNYTLSRGMRGDAVTALQTFLAGHGYLAPESATGFYGPLTEDAVRGFQAEQGVISAGSASGGWGIVGPRTSTAIVKACSSGLSTAAVSSTGASCPPAKPPTSGCTAGWQSVKDASGCTTAYRCSVAPISR